VWPILSILVLLAGITAGYAVVRFKRHRLVDLVAPRSAATRFLATESLYRPDDGHYQFKYLPAFAPFMVPFNWVSEEVAEFEWFGLMVAMAWAIVRMSLAALPDRRRSAKVLVWLTLLLTGKFLVRELAMGQFNLLLALLLLGAVIGAQHGRGSRMPSSWCRGWPGRSGGVHSSPSAWYWRAGCYCRPQPTVGTAT
jgi:hypothetical protein